MKFTRGDILHRILKWPVRLYLKCKFNIQVENNPLEDIREPYLLLGHHVTAFDPIINNVYSYRLIRYVSADANLDNKLKRVLLNLLETIPISKNKTDMKTIHQIMKQLKMGHPVGIYPEGGRNWDGETDYIIPSTAKLIKMMKVPVYAAFYKGGYLSKPRWASHFRKGKMVLDIKMIFDKETIREKSSEEIYEMLVDKLSYNEYDWQRENRVYFKGENLAEDIETLLYMCPECNAVNTIKSKGNSFHCSACGNEYSINNYGDIEGCSKFTETVSWNRWQRALLPEAVKNGFTFSNSEITFEKIDVKNGDRGKQTVNLTFSDNRLVIEYKDGESEVIDIAGITGLSVTFADILEFFVEGMKYRLTFDAKKHMSIMLFHDLLRLKI